MHLLFSGLSFSALMGPAVAVNTSGKHIFFVLCQMRGACQIWQSATDVS